MSGPNAALHPSALGFDRAAEAYERGRPDYPPEALDHLAEGLGLRPGRELVEIGAGTGKLTRGLRRYGARIWAIDPSPGMREVFRRTVEGASIEGGTAEAIPRPDGSADAVAVGQAFHWFRPSEALPEIHRVLRPFGGLGLIWNRRDEEVDWVAEFGRILSPYRPPGTPDSKEDTWRVAFAPADRFEPLRSTTFRFVHEEPVEQVVDRALSVSFIALLPPDLQGRIAGEVRDLLRRHPETRGRSTVAFPYRTDVVLTRRR